VLARDLSVTRSVRSVRQLQFAAGGTLQGLPLKGLDVFESVPNVAPAAGRLNRLTANT
jgi:hypothetical protein